MELMEPKSKEAEGKEKHLPVVESSPGNVKVKVVFRGIPGYSGDITHISLEKDTIMF
jgi:hypothetical protein